MEEIFGIEFTAYVALAVVLYAIRMAAKISNRYIPITAVVLGIVFSYFEAKTFNFEILLDGIQLALYGIGTVATIKYLLDKQLDNM